MESGHQAFPVSLEATKGVGTLHSIYQLLLEPLSEHGTRLTFPYDDHGRVELDSLSDRARRDYLHARAVVGRQFAAPAVVRSNH